MQMIKIAMIDDNKVFLQEMKRTLEACGEYEADMTCDIYESGDDFLQAEGGHQLVILDSLRDNHSACNTVYYLDLCRTYY